MKKILIIISGSVVVVVVLIVMVFLIFLTRQNQNLKNCLLELSTNHCNSCPPASLRPEGESYKDYISGWKQYESKDKKMSFEYPRNWRVDDNKGQGGVNVGVGTPRDMVWLVQIGVVPKNGISMDDRIQDIKKDPELHSFSILEGNIFLGDVQALRLDVVPPCFSPNQGRAIYLFVDKKDYYISVAAQEFNDPLYDFPIEYLLSTIKIY